MRGVLLADVLLRPVLNEKSLLMRDKSQFFFEVCLSADKNLIMDSVFSVFGIRPLSCNIKVMKRNRKKGVVSKSKSSIKKVSFIRKKIAMVTLPAGTEISELNA